MRRAILVTAALYNAGWMVFLLWAPERLFLRLPPAPGLLASLVGAVGLSFAVCAVRVRKPILAFGVAAKLLSPAIFMVMVPFGYFTWSQAWLPVVNDLIWLPALIGIYRTS